MERDEAKEVGARIRARYKELGLRQADIARELGVQAKDVLRWEKGEYMPKGPALRSLAKLLRTSVDALLGEEPTATVDADDMPTALAEFLATLDSPKPEIVNWLVSLGMSGVPSPDRYRVLYNEREAHLKRKQIEGVHSVRKPAKP